MRLVTPAILLLLALPLSAQAQTPPAPPPSDLDLLQARALAAESRADYLTQLLRRMQAEEAKTAKWWGDYIGKSEP
jgi:hypothetical protein